MIAPWPSMTSICQRGQVRRAHDTSLVSRHLDRHRYVPVIVPPQTRCLTFPIRHDVHTGHYARKAWDTTLPTPRPQLRRAADRHKDQTYYLSGIPEQSLARALFPLAPYTKPQVRDMAHEFKLPTADRKESMGICFVGEKRRFEHFIGMCGYLALAGALSHNATQESIYPPNLATLSNCQQERSWEDTTACGDLPWGSVHES